ncbi:methylcrotonoyl-CoA carboxylase beta chain, mitochondrial-like [Triticum aestivum]|uniref:methylcrotonoyl-CoA carboxylase beta chain, mitochondrial-like n=1 Tax=Triticum aestivum TaxID=4565 RepID=UPI001D0294A7|nr:methylcrotonoyl-CoA carboxylase beta chain, mitochondrial-like [Triticum aestivum]
MAAPSRHRRSLPLLGCSLLLGPARRARPELQRLSQQRHRRQGLLSDLRSCVSQRALGGGGAGAVKRNEGRGKLLPRDRINCLLDPGASFLELSLVSHRCHIDPFSFRLY